MPYHVILRHTTSYHIEPFHTRFLWCTVSSMYGTVLDYVLGQSFHLCGSSIQHWSCDGFLGVSPGPVFTYVFYERDCSSRFHRLTLSFLPYFSFLGTSIPFSFIRPHLSFLRTPLYFLPPRPSFLLLPSSFSLLAPVSFTLTPYPLLILYIFTFRLSPFYPLYVFSVLFPVSFFLLSP